MLKNGRFFSKLWQTTNLQFSYQLLHYLCHFGLNVIGYLLNFFQCNFYNFARNAQISNDGHGKTCIPLCTATITSGTVDIPTASV